MDENLIMYAIQDIRKTDFEYRYQIYAFPEQRDRSYEWLTKNDNSATVEEKEARKEYLHCVDLVIRVESAGDI